jgi:hypothetical protein
MVWSKACSRCGGDLVRMDDDYEPYLSCLQCGHQVHESVDRRPDGATPREPEPAAADRT